MKKQIFILIMALFAIGISKSYGQIVPQPFNCLPGDALHPVAGTPYTYHIDVPGIPTGGTAWATGSLKYQWFVTQLDLTGTTPDDYFIRTDGTLRAKSDDGDGTGTFIASASANDYDNASGVTPADNILQLTWKSFTYDPNKPVFVLIYVQGTTTPAAATNVACTTENLKVYRIEPINAFTLDIDNLTSVGASHTNTVYGDLYEQCIADILSAQYSPTAPTGVVYDFGVNYLYYEVIAANWSNSWNLGVQLSGIAPNETVTVEWSKDKTFPAGTTYVMTTATAHVGEATVLQYTTTENVVPTTGTTVGAAGERIYIRVTLDHSVSGKNSFEGLVDQNIKLAVDGMTGWDTTLDPDAFTLGDVHNSYTVSAATDPCPTLVEDDYDHDIAYQQVKARPTVANSTLTMPLPGLQPVKSLP